MKSNSATKSSIYVMALAFWLGGVFSRADDPPVQTGPAGQPLSGKGSSEHQWENRFHTARQDIFGSGNVRIAEKM